MGQEDWHWRTEGIEQNGAGIWYLGGETLELASGRDGGTERGGVVLWVFSSLGIRHLARRWTGLDSAGRGPGTCSIHHGYMIGRLDYPVSPGPVVVPLSQCSTVGCPVGCKLHSDLPEWRRIRSYF